MVTVPSSILKRTMLRAAAEEWRLHQVRTLLVATKGRPGSNGASAPSLRREFSSVKFMDQKRSGEETVYFKKEGRGPAKAVRPLSAIDCFGRFRVTGAFNDPYFGQASTVSAGVGRAFSTTLVSAISRCFLDGVLEWYICVPVGPCRV